MIEDNKNEVPGAIICIIYFVIKESYKRNIFFQSCPRKNIFKTGEPLNSKEKEIDGIIIINM